MQSKGLSASLASYNALLNVCASAQDEAKANEVIARLRSDVWHAAMRSHTEARWSMRESEAESKASAVADQGGGPRLRHLHVYLAHARIRAPKRRMRLHPPLSLSSLSLSCLLYTSPSPRDRG
eukprot:197079-Rhodomonas_salina.1